jgi:hypothetical protein
MDQRQNIHPSLKKIIKTSNFSLKIIKPEGEINGRKTEALCGRNADKRGEWSWGWPLI